MRLRGAVLAFTAFVLASVSPIAAQAQHAMPPSFPSEDKEPLVEARVRYDEAWLRDRLVPKEQEVEVDRPRAPPRPDPLPPEPALDIEQVIEQTTGRQGGVDLRDRVQEPRLVLVAPRLCLDNRGEPRGADHVGGLADQALAVAEVRAKADVGECHGR